MNHTFTDIAPCRKKLEISFDAAEVDVAADAVFGNYNKQSQFNGFRRGMAPRRMIERKFGKAIGRDIAARLAQEGIEKALEQSKVSTMGDPALTVDPEAMTAKAGEPFSFSLELDLRPDFELGAYKGIVATANAIKVGEDDVEARLQELRRNLAGYEPTGEAAAAGDMLAVDARMTCEDAELVNVSDHRLSVEGELLFGISCPGLVEKLAGARPGAEIEFEQAIPEDHPREALRGKPAKTVVTVKAVTRQALPELDDAFAVRSGCGQGMSELRERLRRIIEEERKNRRREDIERQIAGRLIADHPMRLPEEFVKRQTITHLYQERLRLARMGVTKEFLTENAPTMVEAARQGVERSLRLAIIIDAIAEAEKITVAQEEVVEYIQALARQQRTTVEKIAKIIRQNNGMMAVATEIRNVKVLSWLVKHAEIKTTASEETPTPDMPAGDAAPAQAAATGALDAVAPGDAAATPAMADAVVPEEAPKAEGISGTP